MDIEFKLPQFGMGMQDATVVAWYRQEGDRVALDEPLLEVEAAKTTVEVPSPAAGILRRILVPVGVNVPVLAVLAVIDDDGAATQAAPAAPVVPAALTAPTASPAMAAPAPAVPTAKATPLAVNVAQAHGVSLAAAAASGPGGRITAADVRALLQVPDHRQVEPRARKLARDHGLALAQIAGSGPGGRVVEADVRRALAAPAVPALAPPPVPVAAAPAAATAAPAAATPATPPAKGMRAIIASRMMASLQGSAQLTLTSDTDVTALVRLREYLKHEGDLSYTTLMVKACALALKRHPALNASFIDGAVQRHAHVHVGVAVALDEGLLVPVIRDADAKPLRTLAAEFTALVKRARQGALGSAELSGSTFSISNLGGHGIDAFTPVLNPPEAGILGMGRIVERLVRQGDGMAWRQHMMLSLTFDHRALDGVPAAQFLQTLAGLLAQPEALLG